VRGFNFQSRFIVRRSLQAAFWLIAGLKLTKNSPLLLRADRGRNVYPQKVKTGTVTIFGSFRILAIDDSRLLRIQPESALFQSLFNLLLDHFQLLA